MSLVYIVLLLQHVFHVYFTCLEFISMQVVASSTHEVDGSPSDEEDASQSHLCCEFECNISA